MKRAFSRAAVAALLWAVSAAASGCGQSIEAGHRGVYYNWRNGTDTKNILGEGWQWLAPWNKILQYDVRAKGRVEQLTVLTQDQLQIKADISIRYRLSPQKVGELHANVGPKYYQTLIQPLLRNATRDVISRYTSLEAYRNRDKIQKEIADAIHPALSKYDYFQTEAVMMRHMEFPKVVGSGETGRPLGGLGASSTK